MQSVVFFGMSLALVGAVVIPSDRMTIASSTVFDITEYGARPGLDSSSAIEHAYVAACAFSHKAANVTPATVLVPAGTWLLGHQVTIRPCDSVAILGAGSSESILLASNSSKKSGFTFECYGSSGGSGGGDQCHVQMRDLTIDMNSQHTAIQRGSNPQSGVTFWCRPYGSGGRCQFTGDHLEVRNVHHVGIYLYNYPTSGPLHSSAATWASITNCHFERTRGGGVMTRLFNNVEVSENSFTQVGTGVAIEGESCDTIPGQGVSNVSVRGNSVVNISRTGLVFCGVTNGTLDRNHVRGLGGTWGIIVSMGCYEVTVSSNEVLDITTLGITTDVTTAWPNHTDQRTVWPTKALLVNNTIRNVTGSHCINTNHAEGVVYRGNNIQNCGLAGIAMAFCQNVTLEGNFFAATNSPAIVGYGPRSGYFRAFDNTFGFFPKCCSHKKNSAKNTRASYSQNTRGSHNRDVVHLDLIDFGGMSLPCCYGNNTMEFPIQCDGSVNGGSGRCEFQGSNSTLGGC